MMEKMPILIFRPEMPYSESANVVYFFLFKYFFVKGLNPGVIQSRSKV